MKPIELRDGRDPEIGAIVGADINSLAVSVATDIIPAEQREALVGLMDHAVVADAELLPSELYDEEYGRVVFLPHYGREFLELLGNEPLMAPVDHLLGPDSIMYTMTSVSKGPHGGPRKLHADTDIILPGFNVSLGLLVLLDDFTVENGPTRFYPTVTPEQPSLDEFEARALTLVAPAGSVCWFHGGIWHDTTQNQTPGWRRAVLIAVTRFFIRQRFDMPRMVADLDPESLAPRIRQKLGFQLIPPGSYDEYYLPESIRKSELERSALARARLAP